MASIRRLKKETDVLVSELVIDCLSYANLYVDADKDKAFHIIEGILETRSQVRNMANHPDGKDNRKLVKAHYRAVTARLVEGIETGYQQLEKLMAGKI